MKKARLLTFGEVLTILRAKQGLSVEELAELVEWEVGKVRDLETGTSAEVPTEDVAKRFAKALDIDPRLLTVAVPK